MREGPQPSLQRRSRSLPTHTEHYLTVVGRPSHSPERAAEQVFDCLAAAMAEHDVVMLQERVYGPVAARAQVLQARRTYLHAHGLDADTPCAYIDGKPSNDRAPLSVQLAGITRPSDSELLVQTVSGPAGVRGRLLTSPELRLLWFTGIAGATADKSDSNGVTAQAEQMFEQALQALEQHGFALPDLLRTWIYLRRILDWYGEFNRVRTSFFARHSLAGEPDSFPFPASTGIQGTSAGEECVMDLLAAQSRGADVTARPLRDSSRQNSAYAYGSAFSRAMALAWAGAETIYVSGTASIDSDGRTLHADLAETQAVETLLAIAALLEPHGCSLEDIAAGVLYYKHPAARQAYERVRRLLALPPLPLVPVLADVCRADLQVEIEAVALAPPPGSDTAAGAGGAQQP